ncbi:MAG: hypothetical protein HC892_20825 [Saprospiraceae bacterium]|nr:hypothetical protein [Saprospiraceae bacterium]
MKRMPATNRRLAQWRVQWLIEHSTSNQLLWCIDSLVLRNPLLRQAPKPLAEISKTDNVTITIMKKTVSLLAFIFSTILAFGQNIPQEYFDLVKKPTHFTMQKTLKVRHTSTLTHLKQMVGKDYQTTDIMLHALGHWQ